MSVSFKPRVTGLLAPVPSDPSLVTSDPALATSGLASATGDQAPDFAKYAATHSYHNVVHTGKLQLWRATLKRRGAVVFLGDYQTEAEAARAVDNFIYYARGSSLDVGGYNGSIQGVLKFLNFPDEYASALPPAPSDRTLKTLRKSTALLSRAEYRREARRTRKFL